jgi:hypothetical protein
MVTISGGGTSAPDATAQNITSVIQTILAAQLVTQGGLLNQGQPSAAPVPPAGAARKS